MKSFRLIASLLAMSAVLPCLPGRAADLGPFTPLGPKTVPGETGGLGAEKDRTAAKDGKIAGRPLIRLGNVATPGFSVPVPRKDKNTGAAVVVWPGGQQSEHPAARERRAADDPARPGIHRGALHRTAVADGGFSGGPP